MRIDRNTEIRTLCAAHRLNVAWEAFDRAREAYEQAPELLEARKAYAQAWEIYKQAEDASFALFKDKYKNK